MCIDESNCDELIFSKTSGSLTSNCEVNTSIFFLGTELVLKGKNLSLKGAMAFLCWL